MITCKIFHCRVMGDSICCAHCENRGKCLNRCENHPDRCGCWQDTEKPRRKAKPHHRFDPEEIVTLYQQGQDCDQIAEKLGCARSTVILTLRKAGVLTRRARGPVIDYDMVRQLHEYGLTNKEIAARVECSEASVSIILHGKGGRGHG